LIFRAGLLPAETIENALEEGVKTGRRLGEILVERNLIKEEDLTRLLAGQKGLPYVSLRERPVEADAARLLAEDQARLFTALPIGFEDGVPVVAVADPTNDVLNRSIREALGQEARLVVVPRSELNDVISEVFNGTYDEPASSAEAPQAGEDVAPEVDTRVPLSEDAEESVAPEPEPVFFEPATPEPELEPEPMMAAAPALPEPEPAPAPDREPVLATEPEPAYQPEPIIEPEAVVEPEPEAVVEPEPEAVVEPEAVEPEPVLAAYEPPAGAAEQLPELEPAAVVEASAPALEHDPEQAPPTAESVTAESDPHTNGRVSETFEDDTPPPEAPAGAGHRVSIRLTSGEKLTVADCEDIGEAKGYAKALTKQLGATEADDWPFVNGRFLKPESIVSVDIESL
jgi:hypothetical protein